MPYTRHASSSHRCNRRFQHERVDHVETTVPEKSGHANGLEKAASSPDVGYIKNLQRSEDLVSFPSLVVFQGHECNVELSAIDTFTQLDQLTLRAGVRRDVVDNPRNSGWFV